MHLCMLWLKSKEEKKSICIANVHVEFRNSIPLEESTFYLQNQCQKARSTRLLYKTPLDAFMKTYKKYMSEKTK